jgi:hypothetical protein
MATKMSYVLITAGVAPADIVNFVVKGNPAAYTDVSGITGVTGFDAVEPDDAGWAKVMGVVTPVGALLESGGFKRIVAREKSPGKKMRSLVVPTKALESVTAAIESTAGVTIDGLLCNSVSQGMRRKSR